MPKQAPPYAFSFLHASAVWPIGVVSLALGSSLVRTGIAVHQVATIIAAMSLAFTLEFLWGPLVDSSVTRKSWNVLGATLTFGCLLAMFAVPWRHSTVSVLVTLAFISCSGAAISLAAVKGIMAFDVARDRMETASAFYSAGGTFGKAAAGAIAVLLLAHVPNRVSAGIISILPGILAAAAITFTARRPALRLQDFPPMIRASLFDIWGFVRRGNGVLIAILCLIPFGSGPEAGLMGAISREWTVTPDRLALIATHAGCRKRSSVEQDRADVVADELLVFLSHANRGVCARPVRNNGHASDRCVAWIDRTCDSDPRDQSTSIDLPAR